MTPEEYLKHPNLHPVNQANKGLYFQPSSYKHDTEIVVREVFFSYHMLDDRVYALILEKEIPMWPKLLDSGEALDQLNAVWKKDWHESTPMPKPRRQIVIKLDKSHKPSLIIIDKKHRALNHTLDTEYYFNMIELTGDPASQGEILYDSANP
jgi:hypothetical protein